MPYYAVCEKHFHTMKISPSGVLCFRVKVQCRFFPKHGVFNKIKR